MHIYQEQGFPAVNCNVSYLIIHAGWNHKAWSQGHLPVQHLGLHVLAQVGAAQPAVPVVSDVPPVHDLTKQVPEVIPWNLQGEAQAGTPEQLPRSSPCNHSDGSRVDLEGGDSPWTHRGLGRGVSPDHPQISPCSSMNTAIFFPASTDHACEGRSKGETSALLTAPAFLGRALLFRSEPPFNDQGMGQGRHFHPVQPGQVLNACP